MEELIVKYLSDELTEAEAEQLEVWLQVPENKAIFKTYLANDWHLRQALMHTPNLEVANKSRLSVRWFAAAASIAAILLTAFWWFWRPTTAPTSEMASLIPNKLPIELIGPTATVVTKDSVLNLDWNNFRSVYVPSGRKTKVRLPDGSTVVLNADSRLTLQSDFQTSTQRKVALHGEGYFEIAKNAAKPFEVAANGLTVNVLGTKFTLSNYSKSQRQVVLVEGKVKVKTVADAYVMQPNQKVTANASEKLELENVESASYKAWINNELIFRDKPFNEIIDELERHFAVSIVNKNQALGQQRFNASFDNKSLEEVLSFFKEISPMKFTVENNVLYIN